MLGSACPSSSTSNIQRTEHVSYNDCYKGTKRAIHSCTTRRKMARGAIFVANAISLLILLVSNAGGAEANNKLFREYIGVQFNGVKFSDVPINPNVQFHFIFAFAIDYTDSKAPTNGKFNIYWDQNTFTPAAVQAIKAQHPNVRVAVSLGGDTIHGTNVLFNPTSVSSWVSNAVTSLTQIIQQYHLDGIDIDYEHFGSSGTPEAFADAIGQLISTLKQQKVISFASIAPFDGVQDYYVALWNKHASIIDYVNFQFYSYSSSTTVAQFASLYNQKAALYKGGQLLASFSTDSSGGLKPANGFFDAARQIKNNGNLGGIFVWSADSSKASSVGFQYESQAQQLLAS